MQIDGLAAESLFRREEGRFVATVLTTGPWRRDAQNGGAPSGLIGALVSEVLEEGELVATLQIDLEQPVPVEPLRAVLERRQSSRRVARLAIELHAASGRVVSARALLIRSQAVPALRLEKVPVPGPEGLEPLVWGSSGTDEEPAFHRDAVEHRIVVGGYGRPEPTTAWLRLGTVVIEDEVAPSLAQLLAVADFGSPLASMVEPERGMGLINVDINLSLHRPPIGDWFLLEATGAVGEQGLGLAVTRVSDLDGPLGIITQSQIGHRLSSSS